ncbi:galactose oxidase [Aspergillus violaceofuscus CBS 115571]|uniref:Galactose oxidase n=1 Tax=Aspergillus violaceofuscus (strain CBS 115571) TaxID=1450538 RepID=A0A2V5H3T1_ASPV1|nr:galactose oxidase [Aspergillus violaceofuscus CBS 115571]
MPVSLSALGLTVLGLVGVATAAPSCSPGQWVNLTSIPQPRQEHATAAIGDSIIAIVGGIIPTANSTATTDLVQLYDVTTDIWRTVAPAPHKVNHANAAGVGDKLYLLGGLVETPLSPGMTMNWVATRACYVYDPAVDAWSEIVSMPSGTEKGSAVVGVHGEMIYLAGGMTVLQTGYQDAVTSVIALNTTSGSWQRLDAAAAELPESRQHAAGAVIGDSFYVVGGRRYGQLYHKDTVFELDLTDLAAGWSTSVGRMPVSQGGLSGGAVGGNFYAFGGEGNIDAATGVFNQTQKYDPQSQKWTELAPMPVPRHGTQAVGLGDRVYIPGGGLQQDGKSVSVDGGPVTFQHPTAHFDAYCP